jgi:hypothetical protein
MGIDQTGRGAEAFPVDDLKRRPIVIRNYSDIRGNIRRYAGKLPVFYEQIGLLFRAGSGIIQIYIFNKQHNFPP